MKKIILFLVFPVILYCQNVISKTTDSISVSKLITCQYDKFHDTYIFSLKKRMQLDKTRSYTSRYNLLMNINAIKSRETPIPNLSINIISRSIRWKYLTTNEIAFLIDGKPLSLKIDNHLNDVIAGDLVVEYLYANIERDAFVSLANAKSVEIQIGLDEFIISFEEREGLREFVDNVD